MAGFLLPVVNALCVTAWVLNRQAPPIVVLGSAGLGVVAGAEVEEAADGVMAGSGAVV